MMLLGCLGRLCAMKKLSPKIFGDEKSNDCDLDGLAYRELKASESYLFRDWHTDNPNKKYNNNNWTVQRWEKSIN